MRHKSLAPLFLLASATVALPNAHAAAGDISVGLKGGITLETVSDDFEDVPGVSIEGLPAFGISGGYGLTENFSAELEYVRGGIEVDAPRGSADIDIESVALYAAYRTLGQLYLAARIGFLREEISSDDVDGEPEDDSGGSLGIGGGYRLTPNLGLEADYTVVEEDISWLMLAARYTF